MKLKYFQLWLARALMVIGVSFLGFFRCDAMSRFTSTDPEPVYIAGNPLAPFTHWNDCALEQRARFGVSFYRQSADAGRGNPLDLGTCTDVPAACVNCLQGCNKDIPIGDIHGRWNILGLFYPEANGNVDVEAALLDALDISDANIALYFNPAGGTVNLADPKNSDITKRLGFFSVPISYRKNGIRFEADIAAGCDFGMIIRTGVASIRQDARFDDKTCSSNGLECNTRTKAGAAVPCVIDAYTCDTKEFVMTNIMLQIQTIAETLGWDIRNYCDTQMEDCNISLYWNHCYESKTHHTPGETCWSHYTFTPYFYGTFSAPLSNPQPVCRLFSVPFGNDRHFAWGFTGGFDVNFIETVMIGLEAGFTRYSREFYAGYPVPTNELQAGMFPRKADLTIKPGVTWSFGATLGCYHFLECLSAYIQFRMVSHCCDSICIVQPLTSARLAQLNPDDQTPFVAENIKVCKMENESIWTSSFVNTSFQYDISANTALGFFWQAPVRQTFAYRPTTVMGSFIFKF